jgi:carboxymethylenebutenolidase
MTHQTLTAADGFKMGAYVARPQGAPRGSIIVLQEIFGVNRHIRSICDRLAQVGYQAIAPSIFDRTIVNFEVGYTPQEVAQAKGYMSEFDIDASLLDLEAARAHVAPVGKVGVIGFCLGGSLAWLAATRIEGICAASSFYGGMVNKFANETPQCPTQLHYGGKDASIPPENYLAVRDMRPEVDFFLYETAGHGFNCDQRSSYAPEAAALAWRRSTELFQSEVG